VLRVCLLQEKVEVNGPSTHPVWKYLKSACPTCDGEVTWNFKVSSWGQVSESCVASQYVLLPQVPGNFKARGYMQNFTPTYAAESLAALLDMMLATQHSPETVCCSFLPNVKHASRE
jgi:hypothetical protein